MSTLQETLQAALRTETGTTLQFTGDFHALLTQEAIPAGQIAERILAYARTQNSSVSTSAMALNLFLLGTLEVNSDNLLALALSASTIVEASAADTVVGTVLNTRPGSSLSLTGTAGGRFKLVSGVIKADSTATNYEAATSHDITIRETLGSAPNSPRDTVITITVTNVYEAANLAALTLDDDILQQGSSATINIVGATATSTLSMLTGSLPGGLTLNSGARTITGTPTSEEETTFTIRETLADSANSPRDTTLSITVVVAADGPTLTQTSADGENPLAFDITFGDLTIDEDVFEFRHRKNAGAWVNETGQTVTSSWYIDHILGSTPISLPNYEAAAFIGGDDVDCQAGITRGAEPTVWGNMLSDEMVVTGVQFVASVTAGQTTTGGSTTKTLSSVTFLEGYAYVITGVDGATKTAMTTDAGAITFAKIYDGTAGQSIWRSNSSLSAGAHTIVITNSATSNFDVPGYGTVYNSDGTAVTTGNVAWNSAAGNLTSGSLTLTGGDAAIGVFGGESLLNLTVSAGTELHSFAGNHKNKVVTRDSTGNLSVNYDGHNYKGASWAVFNSV